MHGRCLSRDLGNITDVDIYTRDNVHEYNGYIYGFQQDVNLKAESTMALKPKIAVRPLINLRSAKYFGMYVNISDIKISSKKFLTFKTSMYFSSQLSLFIEKQIKVLNINSLSSQLSFIHNKRFRNIDNIQSTVVGITLSSNNHTSIPVERTSNIKIFK